MKPVTNADVNYAIRRETDSFLSAMRGIFRALREIDQVECKWGVDAEKEAYNLQGALEKAINRQLDGWNNGNPDSGWPAVAKCAGADAGPKECLIFDRSAAITGGYCDACRKHNTEESHD
jgi:hypothetical protein